MKTAITVLSMFLIIPLAFAQSADHEEYNLVIGTYTNSDKTNGIHVYRFNTGTGNATPLSKNTETANPSFLAISHDGKHLYAVSELGDGNGKVNAFSFNPSTGQLVLINSVTSGGDHPCYVSVDKDNKLVFAGNYSSGTLSAIRVAEDGSLGPGVQTITHQGSGADKKRQDKPHVHAVVLSPDEQFLFVPDLGTDKVNIYRVDPASADPLKPAVPAFAGAAAGSGPRHLTFHPAGKAAYLVEELTASVTVFRHEDGTLAALQNVSMLAPGFTGSVGAADIHVSPDGKFLYASNRGDANDIAIYAIDNAGKLAYRGSQSTLGRTPRNFAIDPSGNFLLVANQNTNDVVVFRRDGKTGLLTDTGKRIQVDKPVCLKFAKVH